VSNNTFEAISKQINGVRDKAAALTGTYHTQSKTIGQLKDKITEYRKASDNSYRLDHVKKYNQLIAGTKRKIDELEASAKTCGEKTQSIFGSVFGANLLMKGLGIAKSGISGFANDSVEAYQRYNVAKTQLTQVMKNTMGAGKWDTDDIVDLTKAQQKLGVVSSDVQLAGAKEASSYITKKSSLEKLIPTMNNALAFQHGLNSTQEQAVSLATMMGKVLDGQTGALSRQGYSFTEAEEKILKYGKESERVAVLVEVMERTVKDANAALAATPEGKAKQNALEYEEVNLRVGELLTKLRGEGSNTFKKLVVTLYENRQQIVGISKVVTTGAVAWGVYTGVVKSGITWTKLKTSAIATKAFTVNLFTGKLNLATKAMTAFSAVSKMNPVGAITAAVMAGASAFMLFRKRNSEATDTLKKAGDYSKEYYSKEKNFLDEHFAKMQKANAGSKERNRLVDELKARYPGLNAELERELRTAQNLSDAKEKMIGLIKKEAIAKGMKQLMEEQAKSVADAELAAFIEEEENKAIRKHNDRVAEQANRFVGSNGVLPANDAVIGAYVSTSLQYKSEKSKAKKALAKAEKNFQSIENLLKTKENDLISSLAGTGTGVGGSYDNSGDTKTSTASDAITGGGRQVKNFYITIGSLINENTNMFQSSSDDPQSAQGFMSKLSEALQRVVNDANYAAN
jgi:hypothetical protein